MTTSDLEKKFALLDQRIKRLHAMLPADLDFGALDDDQLAVAKLISEEIAASVSDMEKLLLGAARIRED